MASLLVFGRNFKVNNPSKKCCQDTDFSTVMRHVNFFSL